MDWESFFRSNINPLVPYAPGLRPEEVVDIAGTQHIHKLSSNENPYPPFDSALAAMTQALVGLNGYSDGASRDLKAALAAKYGVKAEEIMMGNGANELLDLIAEACLEPGDEVVFGWPSFVVYKSLTQINGATAVPVPLNSELVHDLDGLLAAITDATKLVFICNPNNPTGTVVSAEAFDRFIKALPDHVMLVVDEAYVEFAEPGTTADSVSYFDGTRPLCILRTFSKIYSLAGIRCGYGIAPKEVVAAVDKVREPFNVNSVAQAGAQVSLSDTAELQRRRQECTAHKEQLYSAFDELGVFYVRSQSNFVYVEVEDATWVFNELLKHGIIVRDFGLGTSLRITVGSKDDTEATIAAFRDIFKNKRD